MAQFHLVAPSKHCLRIGILERRHLNETGIINPTLVFLCYYMSKYLLFKQGLLNRSEAEQPLPADCEVARMCVLLYAVCVSVCVSERKGEREMQRGRDMACGSCGRESTMKDQRSGHSRQSNMPNSQSKAFIFVTCNSIITNNATDSRQMNTKNDHVTALSGFLCRLVNSLKKLFCEFVHS